ncbi:MAG: DUF134 domain-containing protein [Bacteroidota bacterium]
MPGISVYKPVGVRSKDLTEIIISLDEYEALRLADHEGMYHEEAARQMNVSRQTFGRIIENARKKTAGALISGAAIIIEGGDVEIKKEADMPNLNRTGPEGKGPRSGRQLGKCKNKEENAPEYGPRKGRGMGLGRCKNRGMGNNND